MKLKNILLLLIVFLASCSSATYDPETYDYLPVEKEEASAAVTSVFVGEETQVVDGIPVIRKDYFVTNPTSGASLDVSVYQPEDVSKNYPGVILVPGGTGSKEDFLKPFSKADPVSVVEKFASEGFTVLIFSADGRGNSEGEEDYNGYTGQDGLYELYLFLEDYEHVDGNNVGIVSYSYGVVLASGMIGRYQPELQFYMEWEGPVNRWYATFGCRHFIDEDFSCDDDIYWQQREALRFVPYFSVEHFIIVQTEKDHAQQTIRHSVEINNLAIEHLSWVRVNGPEQALNKDYTIDIFPVLSERENYQEAILSYLKEVTA